VEDLTASTISSTFTCVEEKKYIIFSFVVIYLRIE